MFEIKKVINDKMAKDCDNLLTKSVQYERKFDNNIKDIFLEFYQQILKITFSKKQKFVFENLCILYKIMGFFFS